MPGRRASYCVNDNRWAWVGALRNELGVRMQSTIERALTDMHAGFLQGCLERWNDGLVDFLGGARRECPARVLLSGSVPLCAVTGIIGRQRPRSVRG